MRHQPAITAQDVSTWTDAMMAHLPAAPLTAAVPDAIEVLSLAPKGTSTGLILALATRTGETVMLSLNAVVAGAALDAIMTSGQMAGWMDAVGNLVTPAD